jgi:hypothetical protein
LTPFTMRVSNIVMVACLSMVHILTVPGQQFTGCFKAPGSAVCAACVPGKYDDDAWNDSPCQLCPEGTYSPGNGTICENCASGKIDYDRKPSTPCYDCPTGRYTPEAYTSNTGGTPVFCPKCTYGKADKDADPTTPCTNCVAGQYSGEGKIVCTDCERGMFDKDSNPASRCVYCDAGRVAVLMGQSACTTCDAGESQGSHYVTFIIALFPHEASVSTNSHRLADVAFRS